MNKRTPGIFVCHVQTRRNALKGFKEENDWAYISSDILIQRW